MHLSQREAREVGKEEIDNEKEFRLYNTEFSLYVMGASSTSA